MRARTAKKGSARKLQSFTQERPHPSCEVMAGCSLQRVFLPSREPCCMATGESCDACLALQPADAPDTLLFGTSACSHPAGIAL